MSYWWAFWYAVAFLTRLPTPYLQRVDTPVAARSLLFYPLVGLLMGMISAALVALAVWHNPLVSPWLLAALVVVIHTALSGGLHLDGLADSADAWVGGMGDRQRSLAIMKDPQSGPMGVIAIVLVLLLKFAALGSLLAAFPGSAWWLCTSLVAVPMLARGAIPWLLASMTYVRQQGLASPLITGAQYGRLLWMLVPMVLLSMVLLQTYTLMMLLVVIVVSLALRQAMIQRLGGCTGDTLGASIELIEVSVLLALALG